MARVATAAVAVLMALMCATMAAPSNASAGVKEVSMKVLVLGTVAENDATMSAITSALTARGTPYDYLNVLVGYQNNEPLPLVAASGRGNYYAIVKSSRELAYEAAPGFWPSALSNDQWQQITDYQRDFTVRVLSLHSWPFFNGATYHASGATAFMQYTLEHQQLDAGVKENMRVDLMGSYVTPASLDNAPEFTATAFLYPNDDLSSLPNGVAAAIHKGAQGEETWHNFYIATPYYPGQVAALQLAVNWVVRGIFLGKRRLYLSMQIDDLFMPTGEWAIEFAGNDDQEIRPQVRSSPADLELLKAYADGVTHQLPTGSLIKYEFAFNAQGVEEAGGYNVDPLSLKARELEGDFWWLTHTFSHPFLDDFTYAECKEELSKNWDGAKQIWGNPLPASVSPSAMVNPAITGLFNGQCLKAMKSEGIVTAVGDNSRAELIPDNLYHGINTDVATHGAAGVFIIPRWTTNIFFDNSEPQKNLDHFNHITPYTWTWEELMTYEGRTAARNLLQYRPDPYMFHQANVKGFDWPGWTTKASLMSLWTQTVVDWLNKYNAFPVRSVKEDEMRVELEERMARDACGIDAYQVVENGVPTRVHATSTGTCKLALSGISGSQLMESETYGVQYGGERTVYAGMAAGQEVVIDTGLNAGPTCPMNNGALCSGNGYCDASVDPPTCVCAAGWSGEDCSTQVFAWGDNVLLNGDFTLGTGNVADHWGAFGAGYTVTESGGRWITMTNAPGAGTQSGAYQFLSVGQAYATSLKVSGFSKAEGVTGSKDGNYALYIDVVHDDGSWQYGLTAQFTTGTHDWEEAFVSFTPTKPVAYFWLYCMFRSHDGVAHFDNIKVQEEVPLPATYGEPTADGRCGSNSPTNAGCPAESPCCSAHGWCGSGAGHCAYEDTNNDGGSTTPTGDCSTCTAGTSGPCKHPDGWCAAVNSLGDCPVGTVACDSASALSTSNSQVVAVMDVSGIESAAFSSDIKARFEASVATAVGLPADNVKIAYVDNHVSGTSEQETTLQIVAVPKDGQSQTELAASLESAVVGGAVDAQLGSNHLGVHTSMQGDARVTSSSGPVLPGVGGVGIALVVGIAAVAVVMGVAVGAVAMRRYAAGKSHARGMAGQSVDKWGKSDRALVRVHSSSDASDSETGGKFLNVGLNRNAPTTFDRRVSSDSGASHVSQPLSGMEARCVSHRQMLYQKSAIQSQSQSPQMGEAGLFGVVTPRQGSASQHV